MDEPRNILITGASGGLGGAVAAAFAGQGDRVIPISHPEYDLTRPEEAGRAVASVGGRLHALIHLMGGFAGGQSVAETTDATWSGMLDLNLNAAFYMARAAAPALTAQPGGRVVMIAARAALQPGAGYSAYNVAKAGVVALVRTLAEEFKPLGATANAILPSVIDTPANRAAMPKADFSTWVTPAEIAALILYLASPAAAALSGAALPLYARA